MQARCLKHVMSALCVHGLVLSRAPDQARTVTNGKQLLLEVLLARGGGVAVRRTQMHVRHYIVHVNVFDWKQTDKSDSIIMPSPRLTIRSLWRRLMLCESAGRKGEWQRKKDQPEPPWQNGRGAPSAFWTLPLPSQTNTTKTTVSKSCMGK